MRSLHLFYWIFINTNIEKYAVSNFEEMEHDKNLKNIQKSQFKPLNKLSKGLT